MRTQYQVRNETKIRRNQEVTKIDADQLRVKNYPRNKNKQLIIQKQIPNCPSCKRNNCLEIDEGYYCRNCENIINKQKHQIDEKVLRQVMDFSNRLIHANTKIREIFINMVNTTYNKTEDMIDKLQSVKGKTKLKLYKNISDYYIEMKNRIFQTHKEDPFSKNAQGISKVYHEILSLMIFLQTEPQVKNMNFNYFDLYYTVIKTRDKNKDIDIQYEDYGNDYINFDDIIPIGIKPRETILR